MKKTSTRFSEKIVEKAQKTLAEKIGPVIKKEEKVLSGKSNSHDRNQRHMIRREND